MAVGTHNSFRVPVRAGRLRPHEGVDDPESSGPMIRRSRYTGSHRHREGMARRPWR